STRLIIVLSVVRTHPPPPSLFCSGGLGCFVSNGYNARDERIRADRRGGDCPDIDVGAHECCPVGTHLGHGHLDRNRPGSGVWAAGGGGPGCWRCPSGSYRRVRRPAAGPSRSRTRALPPATASRHIGYPTPTCERRYASLRRTERDKLIIRPMVETGRPGGDGPPESRHRRAVTTSAGSGGRRDSASISSRPVCRVRSSAAAANLEPPADDRRLESRRRSPPTTPGALI